MKWWIIVPNTFVNEIKWKLLFLAWPIKLTWDWHSIAVEYILSLEKYTDINIVSPKRISRLSPEIQKYIIRWDWNILDTRNQLVDCNWNLISQEKKWNLIFERQRAFEFYYLQKASQEWCVMFWLPWQEIYDDKKAYWAMTRLELWEIIIEKKYNPKNWLIIWTDWNFPEIKTIIYDIKRTLWGDFPIYNTLNETCDATMKLLKQ